MCESFFATLDCELLDRQRFASQGQARTAVFSFIEFAPRRLGRGAFLRVVDLQVSINRASPGITLTRAIPIEGSLPYNPQRRADTRH